MIPISRRSSNSIFRPIKFSTGDRIELKKEEVENEDTSVFSLFLGVFFVGISLLYGKEGFVLYLHEYFIKTSILTINCQHKYIKPPIHQCYLEKNRIDVNHLIALEFR